MLDLNSPTLDRQDKRIPYLERVMRKIATAKKLGQPENDIFDKI